MLKLIHLASNQTLITSSYSNDFPEHIQVFRNIYNSSWSELQTLYRQMLADALNGNTISGSNVCGHLSRENERNEEMCVRWYQLASVGPRFQISSESTPDKFEGSTQRCLISIIKRWYWFKKHLKYILFFPKTSDVMLFCHTFLQHYCSTVHCFGNRSMICSILIQTLKCSFWEKIYWLFQFCSHRYEKYF